ncbi:MAG: cyclically-permuted mutarotase family protein [Muribaculaceae bacterium]|jgi:sialate O-acetylesterase|nr:cyclically-permuted mutarotase family protein [Muribaculaceae bacterium]
MMLRDITTGLRSSAIAIAALGAMAAPAFAAQEQPQKKIACIGNSITFGYLLPDPATQSYPSVLARLLGEGYEIGNFGHSGTTLLRHGHRPYVDQKVYGASLDFKPDIAIIHLGVNDTDPRDWPDYSDEFITDYVDLIESYRQVNPDMRIMISELTPLGAAHFRFRTGTQAWRDSINAAIRRVAQVAQVELIDLGRDLHDRPELIHDAVHPDTTGAVLMAREAAACVTGLRGGTRLLPVYSPGAVLQRYRPIRIAGTADNGTNVTVSLGGDRATATAGIDGTWTATLPARPEATGLTLTVAAPDTTITIPDIAIGEVWIASGQSNMEFRLRNTVDAAEAVAESADPLLRFFSMRPSPATDAYTWPDSVLARVDELRYLSVPSRWEAASPSTSPDFSAVAYHFGRMLRDSLKVPVGIVANPVGGATTESWIDIETLKRDEPDALVKWQTNDYIQPWAQGRAKLNSPGHRHPYEPAYLFASGIRPLGQLPVAGTIWYQGESNAHNIENHERLFGYLVDSWRRQFDSPGMPFLMVQLSSINRPSWPAFRDSQRRLASRIPGVGMAVSSDLGDSLDVHPRNKRPVGERLARIALHDVYSATSVVPSGPLPLSASTVPGGIAIEMEYADGMHPATGDSIIGFEVASSILGPYFPASATISGNRIILKSMQEPNPTAARYGWQPFTRANLVNGALLPASTFRIAAEIANPDEGIDRGVSGSFAALLPSGQVMIAGGCNFPTDTPLAPGAQKKFYSGIYTADPASDVIDWTLAAEMPAPMAYGATATVASGAVLIGGSNASGLSTDVYHFDGTALTALPSLPYGIDNAAAAAIGNKVYLAGGPGADGMPGNSLLCLDLDHQAKGWQELKAMPGSPRVQPVVAASDGKLYVFGGFAGRTPKAEPTVSTDGLCYDPKKNKWSAVAGPTEPDGKPLALGGGAAATLPNGDILAIGGVNHDIFLAALIDQAPDYLSHPIEWYRFNPYTCVFNPKEGTWTVAEGHDTARAGASLVVVPSRKEAIVTGGELKPRIRIPRPTRLTF